MAATKQPKIFTIVTKRGSTFSNDSHTTETHGTLEELVKHFKYTLECGESWQHEKGNKKINTNPKTIKSLISNLNNAKNNSAANGFSGTSYSLKETVAA